MVFTRLKPIHVFFIFSLMCISQLTHVVHADEDFTGMWAALYHEDAIERIPGPELADYLTLPLNDAARLRAESYDPERMSAVPEYQCRPHAADYAMRGLALPMRIWQEVDPVTQELTAIKTRMAWHDMKRTIWMDGRPHPPENAQHTWQGFSTGVWEGNMLTTTTTHIKPGYIRRNGVPRSDKVVLTEHWVRHGRYLTVTTVIDDPVFLTEPLVRSSNWALEPERKILPNGCNTTVESILPEGTVPSFLPGQNPYLHEFADWYGLPYEATRGGAETMYPEYRKIMGEVKPLQQCERFCNCTGVGNCE
jgi:hypothetical protein